MRFLSQQLLVTGSMSGNIVSNGVDLNTQWLCSVQANWYSTSSASLSGLGTIKLQISNDNVSDDLIPGQNPAQFVTNWTDYTGSLSSTSLSAGTSSFMWNILNPGYRWLRMAYTSSSGTGVMNVNYFGKGY